MSEELKDFVVLSQFVGGNPLWIQGPGGNTSVKLDSDRLLIKASGTRLNEMSENTGWVGVRSQSFIENLLNVAEERALNRETAYSVSVKDSVEGGTKGRPSMELGFHALIPLKWVAHTHSLAMQLLSIDESQLTRRETFDQFGVELRVVPFFMPGLELSLAVRDALGDEFGEGKCRRPLVCILKNHGVIFASQSVSELKESLVRVERYFEAHYGLGKQDWERFSKSVRFSEAGKVELEGTAYFAEKVIATSFFPDFSVLFKEGDLFASKSGNLAFEQGALSSVQVQDRIENLIAAVLLWEKGSERGLPLGIHHPSIHKISELPTERARMGLGEI